MESESSSSVVALAELKSLVQRFEETKERAIALKDEAFDLDQKSTSVYKEGLEKLKKELKETDDRVEEMRYAYQKIVLRFCFLEQAALAELTGRKSFALTDTVVFLRFGKPEDRWCAHTVWPRAAINLREIATERGYACSQNIPPGSEDGLFYEKI